MYDVMVEEANLWFDETSQRQRKVVDNSPPSPALVYEDSDDDEVDPVAEEKYRRQVMESGGFDVDLFIQPFGGIVPIGCTAYQKLFGKVGLHCYNIDKGTNLLFKTVKKVNGEIGSLFNFYITLEAMDPVNNSLVTFQTCVTHAVSHSEASLRIFTKACRIKPLVPGTGNQVSRWDPDAVDEYYKGDLPNWLEDDDALTAADKLHLSEVKEWELLDNKWLYLYAEFALFSVWSSDLSDYLPFEMKKVVVRTKEGVASSEKLKASNAIFYMSFKPRGGPECRGIIRQTRDGRAEHMCLEARCWIDK
ncbi:hypothetical protein V5N11_007905 [Cardamine amara subsp. amara]|uniref:Uncharacterized protein n=1 Tax=Cardamine amara subsp. amara TaxID=228776 RepID=A0ABD1BQH3_CARAN